MMIFYMDLPKSQKEKKIRKIYMQMFNFLREGKSSSGLILEIHERGREAQFPGQ